MQSFQVNRRLIDLGEAITFTFTLGSIAPSDVDFRIFPRYLESCDPIQARASARRLAWLDMLPSVAPELSWSDGQARLVYVPGETGNYIARLRTPQQDLYRYFAVVDSNTLVYRMLAYSEHQPPPGGPDIRNSGIPIDWAMSVASLPATLDAARGHLARLQEYQQVFDDVVMPFYSSGTELARNASFDLDAYIDAALDHMRAAGLRVERAVLDWQSYAGAVEAYRRRGFDVVDGIIQESECHRGAPWFPYWMSQDFLSPDASSTQTLGMIMDFCAGFHFHGPPDFHMLASECDWAVAAPHADLAAREHSMIARNSGAGPVFVPTLLIFSYRPWGLWPSRDWSEQQQSAFVMSFLDDTAFAYARKYPIVFARCLDIADYMRDHPAPQPRRIVSSITHDWLYDRIWSPEWCNAGVDIHRGVLPWNDSLDDIRRRRPFIWAKPTARELIYYEDAECQCRFEYCYPKPLLWHDYDDHTRAGRLAGRPERHVPDPAVELQTTITAQSYQAVHHIRGGSPYPDYKLALWDIPREFAHGRITTDAKEFILVENSDGDYRGLLIFDLRPEMELTTSFWLA